MNMLKIAAISLLLAGCQTPPVRVEYEKVPVAVSCVKPGSVPTRPAKAKLTGDHVDKLLTLLGEKESMEQYAGKLEVIVKGCEDVVKTN